MEVTTDTLFWLALVPVIGAFGFAFSWRLLRQRWLPDADRPTMAVLSTVLVTAAWLTAFHLVAFGRMLGWLAGLSIPLIAFGFSLFLALTCSLLSRFGTPVILRSLPTRSSISSWPLLILAPVVIAHLLLVAEGLSRMPAGHDGLKYRLPLVVTWLKTDALVMRPDIWLFSLPANGELVLWWLLKGGLERVASIAYAPAALLLAAAAWSIVRSQRGSRFAAALAVAILSTTYLVAFQVSHAYIDLFGTSFLTAGVASFFLAIGRLRTPPARRLLVIVAGLAIGIALGTKPVNWAYALVIAAVFFFIHVWRCRRHHDLVFLAPAFGLACLACSAFWFVRAAMQTGNPFYPVQVAVGNRVLFEGVRLSTHYEIYDSGDTPLAELVVSSWPELVGRLAGYAVTLNMLSGGVGPLFTMFVPLGMLAALWMLVARGRRAMRRNRLTIAVLTAAVFLLWIGPMQHYARFGMIYLVLATCMAVPVIGWTARHRPRVVGAGALLATVLACAIVTIGPTTQFCRRLASGDLSRSTYYNLPPLIDQWPAGTRVVNLSDWLGSSALTYPLYGHGLKNDVIEYMTTTTLFPEMRPTVEQLQELNVEYVFIAQPFRADWPTDPRLELIYDDSTPPEIAGRSGSCRIYQVPPPVAREDKRLVAAGRSQ